jgi:hypothetical protein
MMIVCYGCLGASVLLPHAQTIYVDPEEGGGGRRLLSMRQSSADSREAYRVHGRWTSQGYVVPTNGNSTFDYNNKVITYSYSSTYLACSCSIYLSPLLSTSLHHISYYLLINDKQRLYHTPM